METIDTIIEPSEFTNFLDSGALLRTEPNRWLIFNGPFEATARVERGQVALYHPDFFMKSAQKFWIPRSFYVVRDTQLLELCQGFKGLGASCASINWEPAEFQSFRFSYDSILQRIQKDSLKKAVPVVFERSKEVPDKKRLAAYIENLVSAPESLFVYGFWQSGIGTLGATPELLLRKQGDLLKTMALAGTYVKAEKQTSSLMENLKERLEHDLVVQDILLTLGDYGALTQKGPEILDLPTLLHLKTEIECQLTQSENFDFFAACRGLHPTPALGVSPREYGYQWMQELPEQADRQGFGAPWGVQWSEDEALCLVAIRNLQWSSSGSRIGSGCGIVAQSQLEREWSELFEKRQSVKKVLGL
ncbi:MAG: chorismate-binding protein [Bdellovibrionaceae bacterium]|nr:chorismate-binding protein [Pseudobdellovibrionaceae bacterium]